MAHPTVGLPSASNTTHLSGTHGKSVLRFAVGSSRSNFLQGRNLSKSPRREERSSWLPVCILMRIVNARHGEKKRAKVSRVAAKECGPGQEPWGGGSAGPAVRPCGSSSDAGSCRTANKTIGISHGRAVKGTARWKSRKAGERALRYISSCVLTHAGFPTPTRKPQS